MKGSVSEIMLPPAHMDYRWKGEHEPEEGGRRAAQPPLVRGARPALVRPPLADQADGLRRGGLQREAGRRDHQHLERYKLLPHPLQGEGRGGQTWRLAGWWVSGRTSGDVSLRAVPETLDDAVQELPRHGDRGAIALLSHRRRGVDGRLRQDYTGPAYGCDLDGPAGPLCSSRTDAE